MPVRLRITFLFLLLVFLILGIVCGSIYYFSYRERITTIKTRLTNRAITTGRLFSKREIFDRSVLRQIDSLTSVSLKEKIAQIFNSSGRRIYSYSDLPNDSLRVDKGILDKARNNGSHYFRFGNKEAVASGLLTAIVIWSLFLLPMTSRASKILSICAIFSC